jgi:hypothetical protein
MKQYGNPALPALFCIFLVFMGSYFLLNLMLAVVMEAYMQSEIMEGKRIADELEEEIRNFENREKILEENRI